MADKLFISPREAWQRSGLPRDEVYRRLHSGELPCLRRGNRFLVPVRALDALVDELLASRPAGADDPRSAA